jgi:ATP-dependent Clp protease adaptor protein ClpS
MSQDDFSTGTVELEDAELRFDQPPLYTVVILNDDFTPMEFVVYVLQKFFDYDHAKSTEIMLQIHNEGKGYCGAFSLEIAETKSQQNNQLSKENEHPLKTDIEELAKD